MQYTYMKCFNWFNFVKSKHVVGGHAGRANMCSDRSFSCVSLVHLHLRAKSLATVVPFTVLDTWGSEAEDCWFEASLGNDMSLHLKKV